MRGKRKATTQLESAAPKQLKTGNTAKKLSAAEKEVAKQRISRKFSPSAPAQAVRLSTRLKRAPKEIALADMGVLDGPFYVAFDDPDDAPEAMARGCRTAEITIGPFAGVPAEMGSDAEGELPSVLSYANTEYGKHFISGHAINADLGGSGTKYQNLTCLTEAANHSQTKFDNAIKRAKILLSNAYNAILEGMPIDPDYIRELGYGIKIKITMSNETWGTGFPDNCISEEMKCEAEVVHAPSKEDLEVALGGADKIQKIRTAENLIKLVADAVEPVRLKTISNGRSRIS
jgi:hypothetical protein